jgi:hypothetical protein
MKKSTPRPQKKNTDHKMKITNGIEIVTQQLCLNEFHKFFSENTTTNFPSFPMPKSGPLGGRSWVGLKMCKPPSHREGIYTCNYYIRKLRTWICHRTPKRKQRTWATNLQDLACEFAWYILAHFPTFLPF